jgi:TfoX/Sxy family transcriptional regulator of competence genes
MAKRAPRPSVLAEGSFGAFVLDQLSALRDVEARPMFGGAGFYLGGEFFGILYKEKLYFRVSPDTINDYTSRKMRPFEPFEGKKGQSRRYYEVPLEIIESADDLMKWANKSTAPSPKNRRPR